MANANMKFKADLLPNTDLGYNLGDSSHRWNIYGDLTGNASSATSAKALASFATIGATSSNHALALQTYFNNNKSSIPRNQLINFYDSTNGNGSTTFGYFLSGYDSNPYGGFYVAHYNAPYYVGISNGNYIEQTLLTSTNYNSYTVKKDGTGASGTWEINISGNAATATKASYVEGTNDAANPGGALLRSGSGRADASPAGDTWIYWDTLGGTTNYWGIRHNQGANTIGFYGGGNERVTISMGESKVTATTFAGKATSAGTADKLDFPTLIKETDIATDGIRGYQGSGSNWTGSLSSMQYAGILSIGGDYSRGWQIWGTRGDSSSLHWRHPNSAATAWQEEHIILDDKNYTSYTVTKTGSGASGTWGISISGNASTADTAAVANSVAWANVSGKPSTSISWSNGTTAGPTLTVTAAGSSSSAVAVPSASETQSGIVTTGNQLFRGRKAFGYIDRYGKSDNGTAARWIGDTYLKNAAGTQVAEYWYDCGDATNITTGKYTWRQYSPNSTADTSTTSFYEQYSLPTVNSGMTANAGYSILTTKDYTSWVPTKTGGGATGTWGISITGNAATATKTGVAGIWLYPENNNELNIGGTNTSTAIYFGYRAKDSRAIPAKFVFGGSTGSADLQAKTVYLGSGTSNYISSSQYTGKAATAGTADKISNITTADAANSSDTWRNVWISYSDNATGRPAYDTDLAYQTSTDTLKSSKYQLKNKARMEYNDTTNAIDFIFL